MATRDLRGLRAEYLGDIAHLCHIPSPQVNRLTLTDFAIYLDWIDAYIKANTPKP